MVCIWSYICAWIMKNSLLGQQHEKWFINISLCFNPDNYFILIICLGWMKDVRVQMSTKKPCAAFSTINGLQVSYDFWSKQSSNSISQRTKNNHIKGGSLTLVVILFCFGLLVPSTSLNFMRYDNGVHFNLERWWILLGPKDICFVFNSFILSMRVTTAVF